MVLKVGASLPAWEDHAAAAAVNKTEPGNVASKFQPQINLSVICSFTIVFWSLKLNITSIKSSAAPAVLNVNNNSHDPTVSAVQPGGGEQSSPFLNLWNHHCEIQSLSIHPVSSLCYGMLFLTIEAQEAFLWVGSAGSWEITCYPEAPVEWGTAASIFPLSFVRFFPPTFPFPSLFVQLPGVWLLPSSVPKCFLC